MTGPARPARVRVATGVVAYNDAERLAGAVTSLLDQSLPVWAESTGLWLVVSPSSDGTVAVAQELAAHDARIHVVVEPQRRGKSAAIAEVISRAEGDVLAFMNGDALADRGSVAALLSAVPWDGRPFALMARPVPLDSSIAPLDRAVELLWSIHHDLHLETISHGNGSHLSDEMMLMSLSPRPVIDQGIICDGSFIAAGVLASGGSLGYAPGAWVRITTPRDLRGHLIQRRRIHIGHRQMQRITGKEQTTLTTWGVRHPGRAARMLLHRIRAQPAGVTAFVLLVCTEILSGLLAGWATLTGERVQVLWERVEGRPWSEALKAPMDDPSVA